MMMALTRQRCARLFFIAWIVLLLSACASTSTALRAPSPDDPWESMNRSVYAFNRGVDQAILRPVAKGYTTVTPEPAQRGVENFFTNLKSPWIISQLLLQGRFHDSSEQLGRFIVNTVYGVGGLFDVADHGNIPEHDTDLGATLATWGWVDSRFVMLPLLGPSTLRDGLGQVTEIVVEPVDQELRKRTSPAVTALDVVQTRAGLLSFDATLEEAFDEYALIRDGWLQRRRYQLFGESSSLPDYDAFLEEGDDTPDP